MILVVLAVILIKKYDQGSYYVLFIAFSIAVSSYLAIIGYWFGLLFSVGNVILCLFLIFADGIHQNYVKSCLEKGDSVKAEKTRKQPVQHKTSSEKTPFTVIVKKHRTKLQIAGFLLLLILTLYRSREKTWTFTCSSPQDFRQ